jgi:hypothetical protein
MEQEYVQKAVRAAEDEVERARVAFRDAKRVARGHVAQALADSGQGEFLTVSWSKLRAAGVSIPTSLAKDRGRWFARHG